jgi:hypothetical protein
MTRTHIISLLILIVAVPAATAGSFFGSGSSKPCFISGNAGYELSGSPTAKYTVRFDNAAANPNVRMQLVDDPAAADFVMVDDGAEANACKAASAVNSIRIDPTAAKPDLTVLLSRAEADYKIYVRSSSYTEQDAAAVFAVILQNAAKTGPAREFAERH